MIDKKNFITARYIDNERKNIEVLLRSDDDKTINPHIIEHDPDHPIFQELLKVTSIEEIHDTTTNFIRESRKTFKKVVLEIAKEDGLLKQDALTKEVQIEKPISELIDKIFLEDIRYDNDQYKEEIFKTKLKAFEYNFIKKSKNRDLKAKLRKAETYLDIICIVCEFVKENYV
tara:strand:- start:1076 stop:1594 length:519 start_codon:yes stop_codon:yes gene_type:complete